MAWNQFTRDATTHDVRTMISGFASRTGNSPCQITGRCQTFMSKIVKRAVAKQLRSVSDVNDSLKIATSIASLLTAVTAGQKKRYYVSCLWCSDSWWSYSAHSVGSVGGVRLRRRSAVAASTASELTDSQTQLWHDSHLQRETKSNS